MTTRDKARSLAAKKAWKTRRARMLVETEIANQSTDRRVLRNYARRSALAALARARRTELPFDDDFVEWSLAQLERQNWQCMISGIRFDVQLRSTGAGARNYAPSPDRINDAHGYTRDNVRWILWALNRAKGRLSHEELLTICRAVAARNPK